MKIIITTENTELWRNLANSFDDKRIKFVESYSDIESITDCELLFCQQPVTDFECLANDLKAGKVESAILFYQQSEFVLAGGIEQGESLVSAANLWQQKSNDLLKVQKQNRRKLKLLNLNQALLNPTTFATQMEEQGIATVNCFDYQVTSDFNLLLASQHVRQDKKLTHLNDVLTASSLPVSETNTVFIDNASVLDKRNAEIQSIADLKNKLDSLNMQVEEKENASVVANKELERERAVVAALKEEIELLELQLASVQEELEQLYLNSESEKQNYQTNEKELTNKLNQSLSSLDAVKSEGELLELQNTSMVKQIEDAKLENEQLELQLASVQEELEQLYLNSETEKQNYQANEKELTNKLNQSLSNLETVKSEGELLKLQNTSMVKQVEDEILENKLLELQLAAVHEELEQLYLNSETEKQNYQANERELTNKLNQSLSNLDVVKSEGELLELQLGQVKEELEEYFSANQTKNKELNGLKSGLELLKKKHAEVEKKLSNSTDLVDSLNNKVASLTSAAKNKDKAHAKDLQKIKVKQIDLDKQATQLAKAKQEIDILNHKLSQTKAEIAQIKSSTFWKSAEPMRRLVKAVGKVDKKKAKLQQDIGLLLTSEYFDAAWYLETYPDVAASEINPAEHYLKFGAQEGRFPSPQFDGNWYLQRYPDIADADINPLIHFIKFGIGEGRSASPIMLVNQNKRK